MATSWTSELSVCGELFADLNVLILNVVLWSTRNNPLMVGVVRNAPSKYGVFVEKEIRQI